MATTALQIITGALTLIGHLAAGETASAQDASDGLTALNQMLHGWRKEGIDLNHIDRALGDDMLVDDSYLRGIRYNLAVELAGEYGLPVSQRVDMIARDTKAAFRAANFELGDDVRVDPALSARYNTRRGGSYDIDSG